jgi:hypothetical protein
MRPHMINTYHYQRNAEKLELGTIRLFLIAFIRFLN